MRLAILLFWSVFLLGQTTSPPPAAPKAEPPAGSADQKSHNPDLGLRTGSQGCGVLEVLSSPSGKLKLRRQSLHSKKRPTGDIRMAMR
jgi:hypothetical protein